ncbi:OmpA family protein [Spongiimicrobium salis]|uniref:OmpA family protein n=1 Tax=Spongiimicrobium salis TaxID=1667022 RepID=UPI00374CEE71
MKNFLCIFLFLLSMSVPAQGLGNPRMNTLGKENAIALQNHGNSIQNDREPSLDQKEIKSKTFTGIDDVAQGYYIIANVFGKERYLKRFLRKMRKKGLDPKYITNPADNLKYVYLAYLPEWEDALRLSQSNLNESYHKTLWIMNIKHGEMQVQETSTSKEDTASSIASEKIPLEEVGYDLLQASKDTPNGKITPLQKRLIKRADQYFNKMWYAEAADLYEKALSKGKGAYSYEILQKAGDSHYFNTNMEKAHKWYTILYENYKNEMSADNLFKYAHALKGTGKYGRAKRLMRIYNKKLKKTERDLLVNKRMGRDPVAMDNTNGLVNTIDIKNLSINTKYSEFSPMFHNDDQVVYASSMDSAVFNTRRYKWNNQPYLDLYVAKMNKESEDLKNAVKFSKKVNSKYHEASVTFSPDNTTMYFTRNNYSKKLKRDKKGVSHLKIFTSRKVNGEWTNAKEVPFNSDSYSTGHPALSPDGKQLYFVSDMPGSIGGTDIFVVDVLENGNFSEPRNLGPEINTEQKEMFPFINGKKLYFSSNGHAGFGGLDVFEVAYDEEGFQEVKNMGKPVNSNKDDFSFIVDEETQKGFFASNRPGGKGDDDIYSFKRILPEEAPENLNAITGVVTELVSEEVMPEALVMLLDENNIKIKEVMTDDDGSFVFEDLESSTKYTIKTVKGDYFENEQLVTTKENEVVSVDVSLKRLKELIAIEDGIKKLKTEMIYFDFDKSNIKSDAGQELDRLVEVMTEYGDMVIKIESHTDSRGKRSYNKYLSDKRAKSTRDYLISKGIDPSRIESAIGYGEERLLNNCNGSVACSAAEHRRNRRSEFIIVKM